MELDEAIEFLQSIEGKTVYIIQEREGETTEGIYKPITLDEDYIQDIIEELILYESELISWEHRFIRDFEHYVIYLIKLK